MTDGPTLRVTPAELAGVAAQVRALTHEPLAGSNDLRALVGRVDPPDPAADRILLASARATHSALTEAVELLGLLLTRLGQALAGQAAALTGAAHGYAYVEQQIGAAFVPAERRSE
jgi:hypothetical protein